MNDQKMIKMLNRDLTDEHAAIIRYLVHGYLEGEDSPLGAGLLSRAREEMWHMHWLGMIIGRLGGEPEMKPAPYPHDPTNRSTIFKSYVAYEKKLIPHYNAEADKVDDPHIKRVLQREAWESEMHAKKFQKTLNKLTPSEAGGLPGEENELPMEFVDQIQTICQAKYNQMLQGLRDAWVYQKEEILGWQIMDFSMTKMKQLAHVSEPVAENGMEPRFNVANINLSASIGAALKNALEGVKNTRQLHTDLLSNDETQKHLGLTINLDLSIQQEAYEVDEIKDWVSFLK
jgi:bacterioferritin